MNAFLVFLVLTAFINGALGSTLGHLVEKRDAPKCAPQFRKYGELRKVQHTMCKYKKMKGKPLIPTEKDIATIINKHNELRTTSLAGQKATAMCKLYWDHNLAEIAQHFATWCPSLKRGPDTNGDVPGYDQTNGQNLGASSIHDWSRQITLWFAQVKFFKFGVGPLYPLYPKKQPHNYIQAVHDRSCRVGCGSAQCKMPSGPQKGKPYFVYICNYDQKIQENHTKTPFKVGTPCGDCADKCVEGKLCDTKGKICYNGGTLDYNTLKCKCYNRYTGDSCEKIICTGADQDSCGVRRGYLKSNCPAARTVCPVMCGHCTKDCKPGKKFIPAPKAALKDGAGDPVVTYPEGGVVCKTGTKPEKKLKPVSVDCNKTVDHWTCGSKVKAINCREKPFIVNIGKNPGKWSYEVCPFMCGLCTGKPSKNRIHGQKLLAADCSKVKEDDVSCREVMRNKRNCRMKSFRIRTEQGLKKASELCPFYCGFCKKDCTGLKDTRHCGTTITKDRCHENLKINLGKGVHKSPESLCPFYCGFCKGEKG